MSQNLLMTLDSHTVLLLVAYIVVLVAIFRFVDGSISLLCGTLVFVLVSVLKLGVDLSDEKVELNRAVAEKGKELTIIERSEMTYGLFFYPKISLLLVN